MSLSVDHDASSESILTGAGHVDLPLHGVEDEEFRLRAEVGGIAQAGRFQVGFGALGDRARVAVVALAIRRFDHVALHEQRGLFHERVDVRGVRIRHQDHVRCFDALPAGNGGTVEGVAGFELVDVKMGHRHGHVLFFTTGIGKTEINKFDFVIFYHLQNFFGGHCHAYLLSEKGCRTGMRQKLVD
jgi:hypothetical protein